MKNGFLKLSLFAIIVWTIGSCVSNKKYIHPVVPHTNTVLSIENITRFDGYRNFPVKEKVIPATEGGLNKFAARVNEYFLNSNLNTTEANFFYQQLKETIPFELGSISTYGIITDTTGLDYWGAFKKLTRIKKTGDTTYEVVTEEPSNCIDRFRWYKVVVGDGRRLEATLIEEWIAMIPC